jgi:hypothetical protein
MTAFILTQEELKSKLHYDPDTGIFNWKKNNKVAGYCQKNGYIQILISNKKYRAHRLAWLYVHGVEPDGDIDHINNDSSDNRLINLRVCTRQENIFNRRSHKNSLSGIKGVGFIATTKRWRARFKCNGKEKLIGIFDTKELAIQAYEKYAKEYQGEFYRG